MCRISTNWYQTAFCVSCMDIQAPESQSGWKSQFHQWQFNRSGSLFFICCLASGGPSLVDSQLNPDAAKNIFCCNICHCLLLLCSHIMSGWGANYCIFSCLWTKTWRFCSIINHLWVWSLNTQFDKLSNKWFNMIRPTSLISSLLSIQWLHAKWLLSFFTYSLQSEKKTYLCV